MFIWGGWKHPQIKAESEHFHFIVSFQSNVLEYRANTTENIPTCFLTLLKHLPTQILYMHTAQCRNTHSSCNTPVISCNRHILHRHIAVDPITHTHTHTHTCTCTQNTVKYTHSDMTATALAHTCMDTHAQSDCIQEHPSYTQAVVMCWEVLFLFSLSVSLSPTLFLYWPLCSSCLHKAEQSGTTDKSWVISQADCWCRGNIKKIWYSYAQHPTHKHYLLAGRRRADTVRVIVTSWHKVAGKKEIWEGED